jgi:hypothetical protein
LAVFIDLPILFSTPHYIVTRLCLLPRVLFIFLLTTLASNEFKMMSANWHIHEWIEELWTESYYLESPLLANSSPNAISFQRVQNKSSCYILRHFSSLCLLTGAWSRN